MSGKSGRLHRLALSVRTESATPSVAFVLARCKPVGQCMIWQGAKNSAGYGLVRYKGQVVLAHRLALFLAKGTIPKHRVACHTCDTSLCCEPLHLYAGTYGQNLRDAWHRKRRVCRPKTFTGEK